MERNGKKEQNMCRESVSERESMNEEKYIARAVKKRSHSAEMCIPHS
jgi:hypothetical protein